MKKINLIQFLQIGNFETQFSTTPDISNKELLQFYDDFSEILKDLDPEINFEGSIYSNYSKSFFLTFGIPFRYERLIKCMQTRNGNPEIFDVENVVRAHNIIYRRNPTELSDKAKERLKDNMFKAFALTRPNITITSTNVNYKSDEMLDRIKDLEYIGIPKDFNPYVFNPRDIIDITTGKKYSNMFLSEDGEVFTI